MQINRATYKIAILEDDADFAQDIIQKLIDLNYCPVHFLTGHSCLECLAIEDFDICLFDWNLPDIPGIEVMKRLRSTGRMPPVIFITGNDTESAVTEVLLSGADDYIVKPPAVRILDARIKSILRRIHHSNNSIEFEKIGDFHIDYVKKIIKKGSQIIELTGSENLLAIELFARRGQILERKQLYSLLGTDNLAVDTRRLDVHLSNLRKKLGLNHESGFKLSSIYQKGYRFDYLGHEP